ncbi:hypothetical protein [Hymenobacter sp. B1770]
MSFQGATPAAESTAGVTACTGDTTTWDAGATDAAEGALTWL